MLSYHSLRLLHLILIWTFFLTREMWFWWTTGVNKKNGSSNKKSEQEWWQRENIKNDIVHDVNNNLNWHLKNIYRFETKYSLSSVILFESTLTQTQWLEFKNELKKCNIRSMAKLKGESGIVETIKLLYKIVPVFFHNVI